MCNIRDYRLLLNIRVYIQDETELQSIQGGTSQQSIQSSTKYQSIEDGTQNHIIQDGTKRQSIQDGTKLLRKREDFEFVSGVMVREDDC